MTDLNGALDLKMLRNDHDVAAGFHISNGIYRTVVAMGTPPVEQEIQMPVLDVHFVMANGKSTHRISISPDMILPLVAAASGWKMSLDQQVASPPVPPTPQP